MLLKVGVVMMLVSLVLATGVAAVVGLRSEAPETTAFSVQPRAAVEKTKAAAEEREFDPGQKLEIDDQPVEEPIPKEPTPKVPTPKVPTPRETKPKEPTPRETEPRELQPRKQVPKPRPGPAPVPDWPQPAREELASANGPRYYQPPSGADMTLTIEALGLHGVPVISSPSYEVLDRGLMHEPETSLPWDPGAQRNVFIAGHHLGWPGTASHLVFYNLDELRSGDEVVLEDSGGLVYRYVVSEAFEAMTEESWVMGQEVGRDMVTLQTCIPPSYEERLVVRADRA